MFRSERPDGDQAIGRRHITDAGACFAAGRQRFSQTARAQRGGRRLHPQPRGPARQCGAVGNHLRLDPRGYRVLACLVAGRSLAETASELRVSTSTVRTHLDVIFRKTGVGRQAELMLLVSQLSPPVKSQQLREYGVDASGHVALRDLPGCRQVAIVFDDTGSANLDGDTDNGNRSRSQPAQAARRGGHCRVGPRWRPR